MKQFHTSRRDVYVRIKYVILWVCVCVYVYGITQYVNVYSFFSGFIHCQYNYFEIHPRCCIYISLL